MKLLILTFYFPPDLAAGSFRMNALVEQLRQSHPTDEIVVVTTMPNRYHMFQSEALPEEQWDNVVIHRLSIPDHKSGLVDQVLAFTTFAMKTALLVRRHHFDVVFATSSRLMTAALGSFVARRQKAALYLDIRDLFTDTVADLYPGWISRTLLPFVRPLERWVFRSARRINVVSPGFEAHVLAVAPRAQLDHYTNGIDREFHQGEKGLAQPVTAGARAVVLYAGNIGGGQALEGIIPAVAIQLAASHDFVVIGDGGRREALENAVAGLPNVSLRAPVPRDELVELYAGVDVLMLHLNDIPAFEKVLPSKIFEYGATGKPIVAGVAGYASRFIEENLENALVFRPLSVEGMVASLKAIRLEVTPRTEFCARFDRAKIMSGLAGSVFDSA